MRSFREFTFQVRAAWKCLTSIFKTEWTIEDYPLNTRSQSISETSSASRRKPFPWTVAVINWPGMLGGGDTRLQAYEDLRKTFERFKASNKDLPRPGTKVPVNFASRSRVDQHAELAKDFIKRVLGIEWAWISDESSLGDFHHEESNEKLVHKIRSIYGVDVANITSGNLADILDRIAVKVNSKPD